MAGQEAKEAYADDDIGGEPAAPVMSAAEKLSAFLQVPNLAAELNDKALGEISKKCLDGYKLDDESRDDWKRRNEEGLKLASLWIEGEKNYPYPKSANVKAPLITVAALQFNARAYPALIQSDRVAKCKVNGHDEDGAKAVAQDETRGR